MGRTSGGIQWPVQRVMAFVDAGYLIERAVWIMQPGPGDEGRVIGPELVTAIRDTIEPTGRQELIRVYIYDGEFEASHPRRAAQRARFDHLAASSSVRLRLGEVVERAKGTNQARLQQKGVDTLLVLDLLRMAQQGAYDTAFLVAGDRDFSEAVRVVADDYSRRVVLWTPDPGSVAKPLLHACDDCQPIPRHLLVKFVAFDPVVSGA